MDANPLTTALFSMGFSGSREPARHGVTCRKTSANGRAFIASSDAGHWRDYGGNHGRPDPRRGCAGRPSNDRKHRDTRATSGSGRERGTSRQGFGRSRGGFRTKIHLRINAAGLPMSIEITPGQTSDYLGSDLVMADNLPELSALLADRGYDSDSTRKKLGARDVLTQIPMRKLRKMRVGVDHSLFF